MHVWCDAFVEAPKLQAPLFAHSLSCNESLFSCGPQMQSANTEWRKLWKVGGKWPREGRTCVRNCCLFYANDHRIAAGFALPVAVPNFRLVQLKTESVKEAGCFADRWWSDWNWEFGEKSAGKGNGKGKRLKSVSLSNFNIFSRGKVDIKALYLQGVGGGSDSTTDPFPSCTRS